MGGGASLVSLPKSMGNISTEVVDGKLESLSETCATCKKNDDNVCDETESIENFLLDIKYNVHQDTIIEPELTEHIMFRKNSINDCSTITSTTQESDSGINFDKHYFDLSEIIPNGDPLPPILLGELSISGKDITREGGNIEDGITRITLATKDTTEENKAVVNFFPNDNPMQPIPPQANVADITKINVRNAVRMADWTVSVADKHRGNGSKMYKNGDVYSGDLVDGETVGYGVMAYASGDIAKGQWTQGSIMNGYGYLSYYSSDSIRTKYVGEFQNDKRHGYGKTTKKGGTKEAYTYEGQYSTDKRHGYGMLKYKDGDTFEGLYKQGLRSGRGET